MDTADPLFYCEIGALRTAKERLVDSVDSSRGLVVVLGDPGTGKTSLSGALEQELLVDDRLVLGKVLDPMFATDVEFLIAIGRVFGLALPPRSSAALKNALKNFFFETAILEKRTLALVIDEAQNLSDDNLEALRLLLNYHVPQRKLLNILLFGQTELESRILSKGNFVDRVDRWIRLERLDDATASAIVDFRLQRAGLPPGQQLFTPGARALVIEAGGGLPRRLMLVAHLAMAEAAERASSLVNEHHVSAALAARGLPALPRASAALTATAILNGSASETPPRLFSRIFARRAVK